MVGLVAGLNVEVQNINFNINGHEYWIPILL